MFIKIAKTCRKPSVLQKHIGQRQSQSPESVAPNVRVRNPIGQSQSPVNTSTGCRETRKRRQRVSNRESVTPRKPRGGSRNPEENRKSTTKSRSPLKAIYLFIYLNQSIYLSIDLSIFRSIDLSIYPSTHPSIHPSIYLNYLSISIYLSIYLSI